MQRIMAEVRKALDRLSDRKERLKTKAAVREAFRLIQNALARNPDLSPFGPVPFAAPARGAGGAGVISPARAPGPPPTVDLMGDAMVRLAAGRAQTMTLLAHHFLVRLRIRLSKKAAALTVSQTCLLLNAVLPRRPLTPPDAIELVRRMQRCNYAAYRSHHKRQRYRRRQH